MKQEEIVRIARVVADRLLAPADRRKLEVLQMQESDAEGNPVHLYAKKYATRGTRKTDGQTARIYFTPTSKALWVNVRVRPPFEDESFRLVILDETSTEDVEAMIDAATELNSTKPAYGDKHGHTVSGVESPIIFM